MELESIYEGYWELLIVAESAIYFVDNEVNKIALDHQANKWKKARNYKPKLTQLLSSLWGSIMLVIMEKKML